MLFRPSRRVMHLRLLAVCSFVCCGILLSLILSAFLSSLLLLPPPVCCHTMHSDGSKGDAASEAFCLGACTGGFAFQNYTQNGSNRLETRMHVVGPSAISHTCHILPCT